MLRWPTKLQRLVSLKDFVGAIGLQTSFLGPIFNDPWPQGSMSLHSTVDTGKEFVSLNNIADNPKANKKGKRLGRGIGSGKGKTSGRGHKGQKARTGRQVKIGFEGGQTPIKRYAPKRGFHNPHSLTYTPLNLDHLKRCIDSGRLQNDGVITMKELRDTGTIQRRVRDGVKLLGMGRAAFDKVVHMQVSQASASAKEAVEKLGGSVTTVYYNKLGLRALLQPEWFDKKERLLPRPARPPPKKKHKYDTTGSLPPLRDVPARQAVA